jgi:hypothetical protein
MDNQYRIRVELPDEPGRLAAVAAAIGAAGGHLVSHELREIDGPSAVDELLADLPDGPAPLAVAIASSGAGTLLSASTHRTRAAPVDAGAWARRRVDDGTDLRAALGDACAGAAAWVHVLADALADPTGRLALERGSPIVRRCDGRPAGPALPESVWLLAVPDDELHPQRVGFLARPLSLRFSAGEAARAAAVMACARGRRVTGCAVA